MHWQRVKKLGEELSKPLPGVEAQLRLSPPARHIFEADKSVRASAVLIVLYPVEQKTHTVFIKRAEYNGVHSGQVSLPGGMFNSSDDNLQRTALRETREETGVQEQDVEIIGNLTKLYIPVSRVNVFPFVGICHSRPKFTPDPYEVKYLIETDLEELSDPANQKQKIMLIGDHEIEIPYFDIRGDHIWGATAMIMSEFMEIIKKI